MTELLAALLGAIAAGSLQFIDRLIERRRHSEATLVAIASEVDAICRLIYHQRYEGFVGEAAEAIRQGTWDGRSLIIDVRSDYFAVFHANGGNLGLLQPEHAAKIVNFYAYCKSVIDSTRFDGPHTQDDVDLAYLAENIHSLESLLRSIMALGEEIRRLPRRPLPQLDSARKPSVRH